MTDINKDKLLATIKALFAKTVESGATEAEALAAVEKARELIEKYQVDLGAEELKREGFVRKTINLRTSQFAFVRRILNAIEDFCEVKIWYQTFAEPCVTVLGLASDAEWAVWLIESLTMFALGGAIPHVAVERKIAIAQGTPLTSVETKEVHRSYLLGCADRISFRLRQMAQQRRTQAVKPGSYGALITIDKPDLIDAERKRLGIRIHAGSALTGGRDHGSFEAGNAHGEKASFGRPVGGRLAGLIERK
jgi:hypothetical protein